MALLKNGMHKMRNANYRVELFLGVKRVALNTSKPERVASNATYGRHKSSASQLIFKVLEI